jgi:ribonuclease BN (tRNA processing enzyme)
MEPDHDTTVMLDVLGAGPAYTDQAGATGASYLVRTKRTSIVLDLGQGSFPRLAGSLEPSTLDAIVISHLHPDHFIDLVALRHYLLWEFAPARRVRVIAPRTLADRLDALHDQPGFSAASLDVDVLTEGIRVIGDIDVRSHRIHHTDDSYAFRVSWPDASPSGRGGSAPGPGLVYSGDCGRASDLDALIRPGDTLLSEVSFGPGPIISDAPHLDGPAVGALAQRTSAGAVLLTHLQMGHDIDATIASVSAGYDGPVSLVRPGDRIDLSG